MKVIVLLLIDAIEIKLDDIPYEVAKYIQVKDCIWPITVPSEYPRFEVGEVTDRHFDMINNTLTLLLKDRT